MSDDPRYISRGPNTDDGPEDDDDLDLEEEFVVHEASEDEEDFEDFEDDLLDENEDEEEWRG